MTDRVVLGVLAVMGAASCRSATPSAEAQRAQEAVAAFYSWYVPISAGEEAHMRGVREQAAQFADTLVAALRADSAERARAQGEIVGLEGDPFLNAQDPCERYQPTHTTHRGARYVVEVVGSGGCATHDTADVMVEVSVRDTNVVFENFVYSQSPGDDLLSRLRRQ